ncbi:hypothetical protein K0M31_009404, partial [Melipona bicolor]
SAFSRGRNCSGQLGDDKAGPLNRDEEHHLDFHRAWWLSSMPWQVLAGVIAFDVLEILLLYLETRSSFEGDRSGNEKRKKKKKVERDKEKTEGERAWNARPTLRAVWYWVNYRLRETNDTETFAAIIVPWKSMGRISRILSTYRGIPIFVLIGVYLWSVRYVGFFGRAENSSEIDIFARRVKIFLIDLPTLRNKIIEGKKQFQSLHVGS